jgi:hypothetical protein
MFRPGGLGVNWVTDVEKAGRVWRKQYGVSLQKGSLTHELIARARLIGEV